ncbi:heme NO-binding domain-containing protein [Oscillatoriales cyanobacterium LEGE 11467]|uniref:Heme NO-binding domain-containing protein n=1 Tax=Zarconia navalis LEGE 11467 TaxID=1828826 RepID=A0A928W1E5_9CYAN|nr:heme NO-binding domain-containing protein [Zarconia navalis]MBE9042196.1 heme NO-binding domain-containing protein [Zarconia navalis LEGE 11467]
MHRVLHADLKNYIVECHSKQDYKVILEKAGYLESDFEGEEYYNDSLFENLLQASVSQLSMDRQAILSALGVNLTPGLLDNIQPMINSGWKTLDFVEETESIMHKYAREEMGAFPPALKPERISENELIIKFISHRGMCGLAQGFINAISKHYGEKIDLNIEVNGREHTLTLKKI